MTALDKILDLLSVRGTVTQKGHEYRCICPAHDDTTPSLDVTSKDGKVMFQCRSKGCTFTQIVAAMGLKPSDCFDQPTEELQLSWAERVEQVYPYYDENGKLLYETVRLAHPKDFRQRRHDNGKSHWNLEGVRRVPYRLPRLLTAPSDAVIYVVEGEKCVEVLTKAGLYATTNPLGAGKWKFLEKVTLGRVFANRSVVILPDNDEPGKAHAADVKKSLEQMATTVTVLELPGLGPKGDVVNWLDVAGNTVEKLLELAEQALSGNSMARPWEQKCDIKLKPNITAASLMKMEFPPTKFAIADVLPEGLTILAGGPKHGKSYLSMLFSWAIASGNEINGRAVNAGSILHLALEDTSRRLQDRIRRLYPAVQWEFPEALEFNTQWVRSDQGGLSLIADWLEKNKGKARLVIIDTLGKFRKAQKGNGNSYAEDYEALGSIKEMLDHYGVSGIVIHHTRKMKSEDPFEDLSGTQAIMGAADTVMVLDRNRGAGRAKLYITGRDIGDKTIPLTFDKPSGLWSLGEEIDGIDTEGRGTFNEKSANKLEQCKAWLKTFLAEFAYPSNEITAAAKEAGFTFATFKDAKAALGSKGTGEVSSKKFGLNEWWSGVGDPSEWKLRDGNIPPKTADSSPKRYRKDTGEGDDGGI